MKNDERWTRKVIFGKTGTGKTFLARFLVKNVNRVLYIDAKNRDFTDGVVCDGLDVLKDYWRRVVDADKFMLIFRSSNHRADFPEVCKLAMACGDMTILVDEMDMFFKRGEPGEEFADLIKRGRADYVELIGITQRPKEMGEIRSMASELMVFNTHEQSELQYYGAIDSDLPEFISRLKKYQYVHYNLDDGTAGIKALIDGKIEQITQQGTEEPDGSTAEVDRPENPGGQVGHDTENGGPDSEDKQD